MFSLTKSILRTAWDSSKVTLGVHTYILEILCDRTFNGVPLPRNITIIGACNPYRYRVDTGKRLAGLIFNFKQFSNPLIEVDRLGDLAYVVYNLPDTMKQLVWDFGAVADQDEIAYIKEMVDNSKKASKLTKLK